MVPADDGNGVTVTPKFADTVPAPQLFRPCTVKLPEVAFEAKSIVTASVVPVMVAPVPE